MLKTPLKPIAQMSMMDNIFWDIWDSPYDVYVGSPDPDPEKQMKNVIIHKDKKLHLFDETVDMHMKNLTIEAERAATSGTPEYPDVVSSGLHADGGDNTSMRNNDTYRYRKPYKLYENTKEEDF